MLPKLKKILFFQLHFWNTSEVAVERIWNGRQIPGFSSPHLTAWGGCSSSRSCDTERGFTRGATRKHLVLVWYYNSIFDFICETSVSFMVTTEWPKVIFSEEQSLVLLNSIVPLLLWISCQEFLHRTTGLCWASPKNIPKHVLMFLSYFMWTGTLKSQLFHKNRVLMSDFHSTEVYIACKFPV